jgi:NitT/TauT family transport system ATP-binding protein
MSLTPGVNIVALGKTYEREPMPALADINLRIETGEIFAFVGPSGCGKSTLLRIIAGLDEASCGSMSCVLPDGRAARRICVFQDYSRSLLPWRSVVGNVALALEERSSGSRRQAREEALPYLKNVGLGNVANLYPGQLSGGMQQRVAIARALAANPDVLLLDEPFGALDALTRLELQNLLLRVWEETRLTIIVVTHDVDEAVYLADRVAVMSARPGRLHKVYHTALPRPRDAVRTRDTSTFVNCRHNVLEDVLAAAGAARQ